MSAAYDYVFIRLARGPAPHQALARTLAAAAPSLRAGGGEVVGQFAPQLGWANDEAAVIVRWRGEPGDLGLLAGAEGVIEAKIDHLDPTIRPADADRPAPGGIYVHRWFAIEAGAESEFVNLSGRGWQQFEALFDAKIFGLFRAEASPADRAENVTRLLLVTRYGDHAAWDASRDPASEAMRILMRRQALTRRTWAASTRLVA